MKEQSVESTLASLTAPAPDAAARSSAKRLALAEFARVHAANQDGAGSSADAQGFWHAFRLSRGVASHGRASMSWLVRRNLFAGVASVCVVGFGIAMVWPMFSRYGDERMFDDTREPASIQLLPDVSESVSPSLPAADAAQPEPAATRAMPPTAVSRNAELQAALAKAVGEYDEQRRADAANAASPPSEALGNVTVTGVRSQLSASLQKKQEAGIVFETTTSDEFAAFPEKKTADGYATAVAGGVDAAAVHVMPAVEIEARDKFQHFDVNPVKRVADEPVSTFSVDVDTASYSFARRMLNEGTLPQKDAVRVEEMINYFDYAWPKPKSTSVPFEPTVVVSDSPWAKGRKLVHIGIKGFDIERNETPDVNLVLLLDVSGSMASPDKLPLAVQSMELLLPRLKPTDTIAIVVYAGAAGTVLEPTPLREKQKILDALHSLAPGGSTAGAEGIARAYELAEASFRKGGVNRILLATDGDFNVGIDGTEQLKGFIERKREKGIFLSVLGFGQGNYRDELAQALAQNGNGVAAYIDTLNEARKVLVEEATSSLFTIAKDVKLQVEFNPATVAEYRLVGYETRALRREDFNNDAVDAGDVGAGHTVTAIYEITPVDSAARSVDESRYAQNRRAAETRGSRNEYGYLKIRYKLPTESQSRLLERPIPLTTRAPAELLREVQFSTAVAGFGQLLRGGSHTGSLKYEDVIRQAQASLGEDRYGYRSEFVQLVRKAQTAKE
jgi:Ca-activated chloride channel homolog